MSAIINTQPHRCDLTDLDWYGMLYVHYGDMYGKIDEHVRTV
jgi:hypothetical protein